MEYKKKFVKKDGRILTGGGPRDQNRRLNAIDVPVTVVKEVVTQQLSDKMFSGEEVDNQIINAVKDVNLKVKELELVNKNLTDRIDDLNLIIKDKDSIINNLTEMNNKFSDTISKFSSSNNKKITDVVNEEVDTDRPVMESTFVDPIDNREDNLVSHIIVKDISNEEKEDVSEKVNKLKNMLGSLKK